jgi:hypothetical protein
MRENAIGIARCPAGSTLLIRSPRVEFVPEDPALIGARLTLS